MKLFKTVIPGLVVIAFYAANAHAFDLGEEEAIESVSLKISLNEETATGVVYGQVCDQCDELKLKITPESRAYRGNTQVGIAEAKGRLGRYATVIFNKDTLEVIRIKW